jgi:hypothetical protein
MQRQGGAQRGKASAKLCSQFRRSDRLLEESRDFGAMHGDLAPLLDCISVISGLVAMNATPHIAGNRIIRLPTTSSGHRPPFV